jgi:hypothetical protein
MAPPFDQPDLTDTLPHHPPAPHNQVPPQQIQFAGVPTKPDPARIRITHYAPSIYDRNTPRPTRPNSPELRSKSAEYYTKPANIWQFRSRLRAPGVPTSRARVPLAARPLGCHWRLDRQCLWRPRPACRRSGAPGGWTASALCARADLAGAGPPCYAAGTLINSGCGSLFVGGRRPMQPAFCNQRTLHRGQAFGVSQTKEVEPQRSLRTRRPEKRPGPGPTGRAALREGSLGRSAGGVLSGGTRRNQVDLQVK